MSSIDDQIFIIKDLTKMTSLWKHKRTKRRGYGWPTLKVNFVGMDTLGDNISSDYSIELG